MSEGTVTKTVWNKTLSKKVEWDCNVPDSKRDILKLLSQTLTGHIVDYEIKDNLFTARVEASATLLYLPEGTDTPGIAALKSSEAFTVKTELPTDLHWDFSKVQCSFTSHSPVFINSRKAGIRGQMALNICLLENTSVPCPNTEQNEVELLWQTVDTYSVPVMEEEQFPFSLNFPLPQGKPPVIELLETNVSIRNPDLKAISNKAVAKGNLEVKVLYSSTHSTLEIAEFSSPFTEILDVGNLEDSYQITYEMKPVLTTSEIMQNEEGEAKNLCFYGSIHIHLTARENKQIALVTDAYSPKFQTKLLTKNASFERCQCLDAESFTVKEILSLSDSQLEEILDISATPIIKNAKAEDHTMRASGSLETKILYKSGDRIHSVTKEIPFEILKDIAPENWDNVSVNIDLNHFSYHIVNQNNLEIRAGLTYSLCLMKQQQIPCIEGILLEKDAPNVCDRAPIVAYIIKPGDTLFQIAKKYVTTVDRLKAVNNIENDRNLKVGSYLIIE